MQIENLPQKLKEDILTRNLLFPLGRLDGIKDWPVDLVSLVIGFNLGINKTLQIVDALNSIALRDGISAEKVLDTPEWTRTMESPKIPIRQKGLILRDILLKNLHPIHTEYTEKIKSAARALRLPKNISIELDRLLTLEENSVNFKIRCETPEDLKKTALKLLEISDNPALKRILEIVCLATR